ncbi:hypothetical protein [Luteimonas sp. A649]
MEQSRCIFEYLYRDAGNFKTNGRLLLTGTTDGAEETIRACLDWGDQFVAEQVRIPALCDEHWTSVGEGPSDLDHAFHEFVGLRPMTEGDSGLRLWGSIEDLVTRMQGAARSWDVTLSPNCDL